MVSRTLFQLVNLLTIRKFAVVALLLLLVPGMAFAMGKGGTGGTGGTGGGGGGGGADFDVIIVGAGAAGLYAAYELDSLGFSIVVLEGRPRHGGRVWAQNNTTPRGRGQDLGSVMLDAFAEVITGTNNWHYDDVMAHDPNRLVHIRTETANDDVLISVNGTTVLGDDVTRPGNPEISDYWDFWYRSYLYNGPDIDVETHLCDNKGVCRGDAGFHLYVSSYPGAEYTASLGEMGMRSLAEQDTLWSSGPGSYGFATSTWLDTLDELYFNQVLGAVEFGNDVTGIDTSGSVAVVTGQKGMNYTAHAVVVTVPLGNLKAGDIAFTPPLSTSKQNAIDGIGFGRGGRLYLQFSAAVFPSGVSSFITEGGHCGWGADMRYKGGDGDRHIQCWAAGEIGDNLDALPNDNARIAAAVSDLDGLYAGTPFTDVFVAGFWKRTNDKSHQLGAYSFPMVGTFPTDGSPSLREDLAAPEGTTLYFAGEATSNNHAATVIGALESGLRVAGEIDTDHDPQ
jgi:monoamine oxidase